MNLTAEEKIKLSFDNAGIDTATIRKDIADTQAEIIQMEREEKWYRLIGDRLSIMRADYRVSGIAERKKFIETMNILLEMRGELCQTNQ